jgi:hypothetical protein
MRAEKVPGLRSWVVDLGNSCHTIFEGVNPPSREWIDRQKKLSNFLLTFIHPIVVKEYEEEMRKLDGENVA